MSLHIIHIENTKKYEEKQGSKTYIPGTLFAEYEIVFKLDENFVVVLLWGYCCSALCFWCHNSKTAIVEPLTVKQALRCAITLKDLACVLNTKWQQGQGGRF